MDKKKLVIFSVLLSLLIVLIIVYFNLGEESEPGEIPFIPSALEETESSEQKESAVIVLFFPSEHDGLLHREEREIFPESSLALQAKRIILELLSGSRLGFLSPIPPETRLRELYITNDGIAFVDFSRELTDKHLSGSSAEMATIFSIVDSLCYNLKQIKKVFILIDGGEKKTLGGHIDLANPFQPIYDIVAK